MKDLGPILKNPLILCSVILDTTTKKEASTHMVNETRWRGWTVFECELCGSAYGDLETAERCEQYCYFHGKPSPTLRQKSLRKRAVQVDPIATHSIVPSSR